MDFYLISLLVDNDCSGDVITPLDTIADELYYISQNGTRSFTPTWTHSELDCPVHYEIMIVENGVERPLTLAEQQVISFSDVDGSMSYSTSDFSLDGQTWTVSIKMKSTYSTQPDAPQYLFDIEFRDACWDALL